MDEALQRADWQGFELRRQQSAKHGKLRGIGLANYVERCGGGGGLQESASLRFSADGSVILAIGTMSNGQGHETAYSQIIAERLGLPFSKIHVVQGDTDVVLSGNGTGGSWSIPMGGGAVWQAADEIIEKGKQIASAQLEAAVADIEFADGRFRIAGTDRTMTLSEAVQQQPDLSTQASFKPTNYTFPYGCHVCEVELDSETGQTEILSYLAVHDFGVALNPLLLAGQVHGGVTQGIGQALLEHAVFDDQGQLLSGSFMDYALPRAGDVPAFVFEHQDSPCANNPLGVKGCGEAGAAGSPPALMNAIINALQPYRIRHVDMPALPHTLWQMMQDHKCEY